MCSGSPAPLWGKEAACGSTLILFLCSFGPASMFIFLNFYFLRANGTCVCLHVGMCVPHCAHGGQKTTSGVDCCPPSCLKQFLASSCVQWPKNVGDFPPLPPALL